jgi:hypothetical protein
MAAKTNEDDRPGHGRASTTRLLAFVYYPESFDRQLGDRVTKRLKRS